MSRFLTRSVAATLSLTTLMVAIVALVATSPESSARAWVSKLSAAERQLFAQADTLAGLPPLYRRALFATLTSVPERTDSWRGVFKRYRAEHAMTAEQDAALRMAEGLIAGAV